MRYFVVHLTSPRSLDRQGVRPQGPRWRGRVLPQISPCPEDRRALARGVLGLVRRTNRFVVEPADIYERVRPECGHHRHVARPAHHDSVCAAGLDAGVVSGVAPWRWRHQCGSARRARHQRVTRFGCGPASARCARKGGASAFLAMVRALRDGTTMVLTADIRRPRASPGEASSNWRAFRGGRSTLAPS